MSSSSSRRDTGATTTGGGPRVAARRLLDALLILALLAPAATARAQSRGSPPVAVTYETQDGWTIRGTLVLPEAASAATTPGVVLVTEPVNRLRTTYGSTIGRLLPEAGIAVLAIDVRGTAGSHGDKDFVKFRMDERDAMQLDIKGAVKFLVDHPRVDGSRIAIVGPGINADYAVREAAENPAVQALVLITGSALSAKAREFLATRSDVPVLALVGSDQSKANQRVEAEPYFLSENRRSGILFGVQRGTNMMNRPGGLREKVTDWLVANLKALGTETEVAFTSSDGWHLSGTLFLPDRANSGERVPGVVFVHGYNHSSEGWYSLARQVTRNGLAALTFDWRGTRKSVDPERGEVGIDLPAEERQKIDLDVRAAVELLASRPEVDPDRIGLIAATATNNDALQASMGDPRIRTFVGLSFYAPAPDVEEFLQSSDMPLFIVASVEDVNEGTLDSLAESSRAVYELSASPRSQFLLYDDAGRGTGMLMKKPELVGMIVRWFQEKLGAAR